MQTFTHLSAPLPSSDEARRTGAIWIAATGAFLILAATAVFIAVRWDRLPDSAKLAIAGTLTGAFLLGGRALRRSLPGTGDVLFHLGAFMIPIDVAAMGVRAELGWRGHLLAQGLLWIAVFPTLARVVASSVLGWAAIASVPLLVCGVAANTPLPAPLLLSAAAVIAAAAAARGTATVWAALAGLGPLLGVAAAYQLGQMGDVPGAGVLADLGLAGRGPTLPAAISGLAAGWVLAHEAGRRQDLGLAALTGISVIGGAVTTWVAADLGTAGSQVGPAALFVVIELTALLLSRDSFWRRPAGMLAFLTEVPAAVIGGVSTLAIALFAPQVEEGLDFLTDDPGFTPEPVGALALAMLASAWLLAGWRRVGERPRLRDALAGAADNRTVAFAAFAAVAAVTIGTASSVAAGLAVIAVTALLAVSGRGTAHVLVATGAMWAPLTVVQSHPTAALPLAMAGAFVAAEAAVRRYRIGRRHELPAGFIAAAAVVAVLIGTAVAHDVMEPAVAWGTYAVACWVLAVSLDRASLVLGYVARPAIGVAVIAALSVDFRAGVAIAAIVTVLYVVEALRLDSPVVAFGAAASVQVVIVLAAAAAGLDQAEAGVAAAVSAVVFMGLAGLVDSWWRPPLLAATGGALAVGLGLSAIDARAFGDVLMISGGLGLVVAATIRKIVAGHVAAAVVIVGFAIHLATAGITFSEAYLAPVVLQMIVAGAQLRRRDPVLSSWVAYAPAVALLGGAAFGERIAGGAGWHALIAGGVAVAAVAAGGWLRLSGPLLLGTFLAVAITIHESLAALAGVPTWAWLAAGGATLLTIGIALERTGQTPADAGRRLVDVVADRFE